jgi:hypothetical protein
MVQRASLFLRLLVVGFSMRCRETSTELGDIKSGAVSI